MAPAVERGESFRPMLEGLEERTLPDASGFSAVAVDFLRTPTGQVFLGEIISQSQGGPISSNPLGQAAGAVPERVDGPGIALAAAWPADARRSGVAVEFSRTPAGLIFLGEVLDQSQAGVASETLMAKTCSRRKRVPAF